MRVFIELPEALIPTLEAEARTAHRPPRYHLEWMITQELERIARGEQPSPNGHAPAERAEA